MVKQTARLIRLVLVFPVYCTCFWHVLGIKLMPFSLSHELGLRPLKLLVMLVMASSTGSLSMDDAP